jgi:AraC-like DNA-binding protein
MATLVRAASLGNFAEVARRNGADPDALLRAAKLDPQLLGDPDLRIPAAAVVGVLEAAARQSKCDTIGLQMAESWRMSDFGAVSLLLAHQRTLRDALAETIRYRHLLNDAISLEIEDAGELVIVREELVVEGGAPRQAIELAMGVIFRLFRALLGPEWKPRAVRFQHAPPAQLAVHRRIFGPQVQFGADSNGIVCDARDLDRPNPGADPAMAQHARRYVDSLPGAGSGSTAQDVRRAIHILMPSGRAAIGPVAQAMGTYPRKLQRRLEAEGERFATLLETARRELAPNYLRNPAYSLTQVSELLGYGYPSSFTRWFSAQFGEAPAAWRAKHASPGARAARVKAG